MAVFKNLKNVLKTKPLVKFVISQLDKGVTALDADRTHVSSGYFNVSDLGYCLRQVYYRHTTPIIFPPRVLKKFFAGSDAGQRAVNILRRAGVLFGNSVCKQCGTVYTNMTPPSSCGCGSMPVYSELGIRNNVRRISGKVDLFIKKDKVILTEVKSASTYYRLEKVEKIKENLLHNVQQANMYIGMIRSHMRYVDKKKKSPFIFFEAEGGSLVSGYELGKMMDTGVFLMLYEDKNSSEHHPHEFKYDHDMYLNDLKHVKKFYEYLDAKKLPPKEHNAKKCKYCDYFEVCNGRSK